jgi:hypothetical protein
MNDMDNCHTSFRRLFADDPLLFFCLLFTVCGISLFASWTLLHTLATFGHIPWQVIKGVACGLFFPVGGLAVLAALRVFQIFPGREKDAWAGNEHGASWLMMLIPLLAAGLYGLAYREKFSLAALAFVVISICAHYMKYGAERAAVPQSLSTYGQGKRECLLFTLLLVVVVGFVLCGYRSDYDDAEYIQTALQTIAHPERAPLTFDSSMGFIIEKFRYQPYRFASYETLVALIADVFRLNILTVYYLILPALGAALCLTCAYLFARRFLDRRLTIFCLVVFLAILLAWGETHIAYGNRVLVRLYQGKGWLIALSTPFTLLCGILLMRRRSFSLWLCFMTGNIAAVGFSSSGLIVSCGTILLLLPFAFSGGQRQTLRNGLLLLSGASWALFCGTILTLKFHGNGGVEGTVLPIESSLGENARTSLALALLAFGGLWTGGKRGKSLAILSGGVLLLIFNPWLSKLVAHFSAGNMQWRLAWVAPVPILLAVLVTRFFKSAAFADAGWKRKIPFVIGGLMLTAFLVAGPWVPRPGNNDFHFSRPTWKLPPEYTEVFEIAKILPKSSGGRSVLAPPRQTTWLTVVNPSLRLVLPGHGYSITLPTIVPPDEFQERAAVTALLEANQPLDKTLFLHALNRFAIEYIVIPKGERCDQLRQIVSENGERRMEPIGVTQHFDVFRIVGNFNN